MRQRADQHGAKRALAVELRRLYEAACEPTYAQVIRRAKDQKPPLTLNDATISGWLDTKKPTTPRNRQPFAFFVQYLQQRAAGTYESHPAEWWEQLRQRALHERTRGGRPTKRDGPSAQEAHTSPATGEQIREPWVRSDITAEVVSEQPGVQSVVPDGVTGPGDTKNVMSGGMVDGLRIQARDVTMLLPPCVPTGLNGLPAPKAEFVGRAETMKELLSRLDPKESRQGGRVARGNLTPGPSQNRT